MICPACDPNVRLRRVLLAESLPAYHCDPCGGNFLPSANYLKWKQAQGAVLPERETVNEKLVANDSFDALICPDCSRIMLKYEVGHGVRFKVDFCRSCNGVWLDQNEWEILASKNLHDEINFFFTDGWQSKVRKQAIEEHLQALFRKKIGDDAFATVTDFKGWLASNAFRTEILAYLQDATKSN